MEPLILVLDVGSSSIRGLLFDHRGERIPGVGSRRPMDLTPGSGGTDGPDPDGVVENVFSCLDQVLDQAGSRLGPGAGRIAGVGICTFVANVFGLDPDGKPLTGLLTYADTRAADQALELKELLDEERVHQRTGCRFHPGYLPAQLRYLARTAPREFRAAERWVSLGEYLELKLFGRARVSLSAASWSGLLDFRQGEWDRPLLEFLGLSPDLLSAPVGMEPCSGTLRPGFAERWPALARAAWFPALGDGATANIGTGCLGPGRAALTMGTSTALRAVLERPPREIPGGLFCYRVDRRRYLLGGALTEGGGLYQWFRESLNLGDEETLEERLGELAPDSHGLTVLPFWSGERSPGWAGQARGGIQGLTLATEPVRILRAAMEAVALRLAAVHGLLALHLDPEHDLVVSGGALEGSPVWRKIVADALGRELALTRAGEASARGAALLVLEALGLIEDPALVETRLGATQRPDPESHEIYNRARERQERLYRLLVKE